MIFPRQQPFPLMLGEGLFPCIEIILLISIIMKGDDKNLNDIKTWKKYFDQYENSFDYRAFINDAEVAYCYKKLNDEETILTENYFRNAHRQGFEEFCEFVQKYNGCSEDVFMTMAKPEKSEDNSDVLRLNSPKTKMAGGEYAQHVIYKDISLTIIVKNKTVIPVESFFTIDRTHHFRMLFPEKRDVFFPTSKNIRLHERRFSIKDCR